MTNKDNVRRAAIQARRWKAFPDAPAAAARLSAPAMRGACGDLRVAVEDGGAGARAVRALWEVFLCGENR